MSRLTVSQLKLKLDLPAECSHPRTDSEGGRLIAGLNLKVTSSQNGFIRADKSRLICLPAAAVQLKSDETAGGSCSGL